MPKQAQAATKDIHSSDATARWKVWLMGSVLAVGAAFTAQQALADSHENITISHGFTNFGELKYPADFVHLDYVNPNAPKGGEISQWEL